MAIAATQTSPILYHSRVRFFRKHQGGYKFESAVDTCITAIRNASHVWVTHIVLIIILAVYTVCGAYFFYYIEEKASQDHLTHSRNIRQRVTEDLWHECRYENSSQKTWETAFKTKMWGYRTQLCSNNVWLDDTAATSTWSLARAVLYCASIYTATGFGNIVAMTPTGQIGTIIYAVIGIPYTLTVLLDIGSVMTTILRKAYIAIYKLYFFGCWCCKRNPPLTRTSSQRTIRLYNPSMSQSVPSSSDDETRDELYQLTGLKQSDFTVPVWFGWLLIIVYCFVGAWILTVWEPWNYREALYFVFASLTTIGFGDYIPNYAPLAFTFCYSIFGLALVSLIFNLVVERISKAMRKARHKIKPKTKRDFDGSKQLDDESAIEEREDLVENPGNGVSDLKSSVLTVRLVERSPSSFESSPSGFSGLRRQKNKNVTQFVLVEISDTNLLKFVDRGGKGQRGGKRREAYVTERNLIYYLEERIKSRQRSRK